MSRAIRVGDFIRDEISKIILHEVRDPRLTKYLAVNDVVVSKDLSIFQEKFLRTADG